MHLLVIEDERALCETIVRSLRRAAYSVDYCCDGEEALELLEIERYDLVLLDLNLPGKDGMTGWSTKLLPPVSSLGNGTETERLPKPSYPMPTHSRHNLMALLSTVATSLRHTPRHTITIPTASSAACAAVFIPYFILSSPSGLCRYHIIVDIRFLLRKIFTQNLSVSCIMRTAG